MSKVRIKQLTISGKEVKHDQNRLIFNNSGLAYYDELNSFINNLSGDFNVRLTQSGIDFIALNAATSGALLSQINSIQAGVPTVNGLSGNLNIVSVSDNINISTSGTNTIVISGIYTADKVLLTNGNDAYFIPFGVNFTTPPKVASVLEITGINSDIIPYSIFNITTSGYNVRFGDTLVEDYYINTIATI